MLLLHPPLGKPKGKPTYLLPQTPDTPFSKEIKPSVDQQAKKVKKGDKFYYGYRRHYLAEAESGLVLAVHTTPAHAHESQYLASCLNQVSLQKEPAYSPIRVAVLRPTRPCYV